MRVGREGKGKGRKKMDDLLFIYMHEHICWRCLRKSALTVDEYMFVRMQVLAFQVKDDRIANQLWKKEINRSSF